MSTVVRRTYRSVPQRDASQTWAAIVELLVQGKTGPARTQLLAVAGIAASLIADQAPKDAAIVVTCDGPRTRIYCLYDDDAVEGSDANEDPIGFNPLKGDWRVSLPCPADDLAWVQGALNRHSTRISARDLNEATAAGDAPDTAKSEALIFNQKGFIGS